MIIIKIDKERGRERIAQVYVPSLFLSFLADKDRRYMIDKRERERERERER